MRVTHKMSRVLITGGRGLVGQHLCEKLLDRGYEVAILSRNDAADSKIAHYTWNIDSKIVDREVINNSDFIIHLAGINIGGKRWTGKRKRKIVDSRIKSADLIFNNIDRHHTKLKAFISASAIGYYGGGTSEQIFHESDPPASDFLGKTCEQWEIAADQFNEIGVRTVKIRTGIVLSSQGGALSKLKIPVQLGFGSAIGNGRQYMPWIHLDDLCAIYIKAIEDQTMTGAYNAVAPEHITNKAFTRKMARVLHKPFWFPNIPAIAMRLLFGEMAVMLLSGSRVSSEKIVAAGYTFQYPDLDGALTEIFTG
jgi:uncharacterized protein (TIGR01777 family)